MTPNTHTHTHLTLSKYTYTHMFFDSSHCSYKFFLIHMHTTKQNKKASQSTIDSLTHIWKNPKLPKHTHTHTHETQAVKHSLCFECCSTSHLFFNHLLVITHMCTTKQSEIPPCTIDSLIHIWKSPNIDHTRLRLSNIPFASSIVQHPFISPNFDHTHIPSTHIPTHAYINSHTHTHTHKHTPR